MPPKIIYVSAISAVPYAFEMKEAWKVAFPDTVPSFYILDVSNKRFGKNTDSLPRLSPLKRELVEDESVAKLRRIGERLNGFGNAAFFDEFNRTGATIERGVGLLEKAGYFSIQIVTGIWGHINPAQVLTERYLPIIRTPLPESGYVDRRLRVNSTLESKLLIEDMKAVGRVIGEEIIRRAS